ncbi:hypothetical protein TWF281_001660 [Arthrobotrys megalospora]
MSLHSFSPVADLVVELTVDSTEYFFLVSSAILRVVSPVWRKALDPNSGFAPLQRITVDGAEYPKTTVEGIDKASLTIVFDILHHQVGLTPRSVPFKSLRDIAVLADQYNFASALSPWSQFWIEALAGDTADLVKLTGYEEWLFIATVFIEVARCRDIIEAVSKQLILDLIISPPEDPNEKTNPRYWRWSDLSQVELNIELVPDRILEFILLEREERLTKILHPLWKFVQGMLDGSLHRPTPEITVFCKNPDCFAGAFGSLLTSAADQGLRKFVMAEQFAIPENSLQRAAQAVEKLRMTTMILCSNSWGGSFNGAPMHTVAAVTTPSWYKFLADHRAGDFLLRNQFDSITKRLDGRFEICPLAQEFVSQQQAASTVLQNVNGYTAKA